jgi:myo-inositol-1(or 4)-monophosphatase
MDDAEAAALVEIALDAARRAGEVAMRGFRTQPSSTQKGRGVEVVTQFDLDSEAVLRKVLRQRSTYAVVGEERGADDRVDRKRPIWYVDPIDGTTNFVHGHPFWCVSVGLVEEGTPRLGAVVAPLLGLEWVGVAGSFARRNGQACTISSVSSFHDALFATGFPYDRRTSSENNFDAFIAIKMKCQAVRRCGSAAIDCCFVADGTYDGYWERKVKPWDIAAGSAIVLGAGGAVTDYVGAPVNVEGGFIVATNGHLHGSLVEELARAEGPARR